jgi:hypothetical protein
MTSESAGQSQGKSDDWEVPVSRRGRSDRDMSTMREERLKRKRTVSPLAKDLNTEGYTV